MKKYFHYFFLFYKFTVEMDITIDKRKSASKVAKTNYIPNNLKKGSISQKIKHAFKNPFHLIKDS